MNELKRGLAAVGVGVCFLPGWLLLLFAFFGGAGILWFLCTWIFVAPIGFVIGLIVLPDVNPAS